jgi:hypothetical protein
MSDGTSAAKAPPAALTTTGPRPRAPRRTLISDGTSAAKAPPAALSRDRCGQDLTTEAHTID